MGNFEIIGQIEAVETIARGGSIYAIDDLRTRYGSGNWRQRKGIALVRFEDGTIRTAEVHWYEAHGIGRVDLKVKRTFQ